MSCGSVGSMTIILVMTYLLTSGGPEGVSEDVSEAATAGSFSDVQDNEGKDGELPGNHSLDGTKSSYSGSWSPPPAHSRAAP